MEQDLEKLGIANWEGNVKNLEEKKEMLVAAKTLEGL